MIGICISGFAFSFVQLPSFYKWTFVVRPKATLSLRTMKQLSQDSLFVTAAAGCVKLHEGPRFGWGKFTSLKISEIMQKKPLTQTHTSEHQRLSSFGSRSFTPSCIITDVNTAFVSHPSSYTGCQSLSEEYSPEWTWTPPLTITGSPAWTLHPCHNAFGLLPKFLRLCLPFHSTHIYGLGPIHHSLFSA